MNDRFKFRFWHKPTNKMLDCYGFNEHCTFANTLDGIGTEYNPCATKDCELMQSTGLKDKNGKLIYEGDIVKQNNTTYSVNWFNGSFCFKDILNGKNYTVEFVMSEKQEVIGNIYENKELLNGTNP